jgi:hypothetical protein
MGISYGRVGMSEQGESDGEQHEVGLLGMRGILQRIEGKQSQLEKTARAQWFATIGLGLVAIGIGALSGTMIKPYAKGFEFAAWVLLVIGIVLWFAAAFSLSPVRSSGRRKSDLTDGSVAGHGF